MNTPIPVTPTAVNVPATTPTVGAIIGSIIAGQVIPHVHDPIASQVVLSIITGLFAWVFHFAHAKLGTPE
jgi:tellurite resistance protein TehA-like permease